MWTQRLCLWYISVYFTFFCSKVKNVWVLCVIYSSLLSLPSTQLCFCLVFPLTPLSSPAFIWLNFISLASLLLSISFCSGDLWPGLSQSVELYLPLDSVLSFLFFSLSDTLTHVALHSTHFVSLQFYPDKEQISGIYSNLEWTPQWV